jgi:hypothetical protein
MGSVSNFLTGAGYTLIAIAWIICGGYSISQVISAKTNKQAATWIVIAVLLVALAVVFLTILGGAIASL